MCSLNNLVIFIDGQATHTLECVDRLVKAILGPDAGTMLCNVPILCSAMFCNVPNCAVEQTKKECGNPLEILGVVCLLNEG